MCIFSSAAVATAVSTLARPLGGGRQLLVHQVSLITPTPVALILPVPNVGGVHLHDLGGYPTLFADLRRGFATWSFGPGLRALDDLGHEPCALRWIGDVIDPARAGQLPLARHAARIALGGLRENVDTWFSPQLGLLKPRLASRARLPPPRPLSRA